MNNRAQRTFLFLFTCTAALSGTPPQHSRQTSHIQSGLKKIHYGVGLTLAGYISLLIRQLPNDYSSCNLLSNPSLLEMCHQLRQTETISDTPLETACIASGAILCGNGFLELIAYKNSTAHQTVKQL